MTDNYRGSLLDDMIDREESPYMTIAEAARYLRVSEHTIHVYCRKGLLDKKRITGFRTVRVLRDQVEALVGDA